MEPGELSALRLLKNLKNSTRPPAEHLSSDEVFQQRLQIGLAAGTGFLFVVICAVLVKLLSCFYGRKEDESVDGRTADQEVVDEQEQGVDDSLNLKREVKAECAKKC
eukprot:g22727.t1